jgi:hypothetical protein
MLLGPNLTTARPDVTSSVDLRGGRWMRMKALVAQEALIKLYGGIDPLHRMGLRFL